MSVRTGFWAATILALTGCSNDSFSLQEDLESNYTDEFAEGIVRIDVYPPDSSGSDDVSNLKVQTFIIDTSAENTADVVLTQPLTINGSAIGEFLSPWPSLDFPVDEAPIAYAEVELRIGNGVQQPQTVANANGEFSFEVVPSDQYELFLTSDDPSLPTYSERVLVDATVDSLDIFVPGGVPVWGFVTDGSGNPLQGMSVSGLSPNGARTGVSITDDQGRYRVVGTPEQTLTIEVSPFKGSILPTIRKTLESVSVDGHQIDFSYPPSGSGAITGVVRTVSANGSESVVSDDSVRVRITAESLDGFDDGAGAYSVDVGTDAGRYTALVPEGNYTISVSPQSVDGPSPTEITDVRVSARAPTTRDATLERKVIRQGTVFEEEGPSVPYANIECTEVGFAERVFTATAGPGGEFIISTPNTELSCRVSPPYSSGLAITTQSVAATDGLDLMNDWALLTRRGSILRGTVRFRDSSDLSAPPSGVVEGALVEVRQYSESSPLLGLALTDGTGRFEVRLDR